VKRGELARSIGLGYTAEVPLVSLRAGQMNSSKHGDSGSGRISRRSALAAGSALAVQPWVRASDVPAPTKPTSVIYIFLSGGLGQQDSFDMKPEAPRDIRGDFSPIATQTPGLQICEHMPMLAARSQHWSVVRSLTHPYNEHSQGHMVMLSGRTPMPIGFNPSQPKPTDHPAIASILGALLPEKDGLPPSIVLPEKLIHRTGRVIPGQFGGVMGNHRDPWFLAASRFNATTYGAWPEYEFHHARGGEKTDIHFRTPGLTLPKGLSGAHFEERLGLLRQFESEGKPLKELQELASFGRYRDKAMSMLGDGRLSKLFDIHKADESIQQRYGKNSFGWSLLLARRLVGAGVRYVQVNLGNNETWDTHGNAFPNLKNYLMPPMDRGVSALLDDLAETGELDSTLIVMAGEFGRTPKVFGLPAHYKLPGRDHWGAVQSVMLAGNGFGGGRIIGSTDKQGGHPATEKKTPEQLAATMYETLGFARNTHWYDLQDRPMQLFNADPIS